MLRARNESLEGGRERREERGKEDERENKVREREGDRFVCVCVCVWGGTNLREEMGALRVLSTPFSSSHS